MKRRALFVLCFALAAQGWSAEWRLGADLGAQLPLRQPVFPAADGINNGGMAFGLSAAVSVARGRLFLGLQTGVLPISSVQSSSTSVAWALPALLFIEVPLKAFFFRAGGGPSWLVLSQADETAVAPSSVWEIAVGGRIQIHPRLAVPITVHGQFHPGSSEAHQGGPFFALGLGAGLELRLGAPQRLRAVVESALTP